MRRSERGSASLWVLGLSLLLLLFGGVAIDFWRGLALQRHLASVADSAAIAAASGIDEEHYRDTGEVILATDRATGLATDSVVFQDVELDLFNVEFASDLTAVTVQVGGHVELGLLGILVDDSEPLIVRASATATPEFVP